MGSEIVTAIIEQKGSIKTNPTGLSPDVSRPVLQFSVLPASSATLVEQRSSIRTSATGADEHSKPIHQNSGPEFATDATTPDESIIEQVRIESGGLTRDPNYSGLIEQYQRVISDPLVEQREVTRSSTANGTPIEQKPQPSNTVQVDQENLIQLLFPPCGSIKNPVTTNILWRINDLGFPFDTSTLIFRVQGFEVQDAPTFVITPIANGIQISYDPAEDFPYNTLIEEYLQVQDTANPPNTVTIQCSFTTVKDTRPPVIYNLSPSCEDTGVSVTSPVTFDVVDIGDGVDPDSIVLNIEGLTVCSGITLSPTTIPGSGTGYHVEWVHPENPFRFDANISVTIFAEDLSDDRNSTLFSCSFDTEISSLPVFQNFYPAPCESFVDNTTGLSFEVYGVEHGVDISTLEVRVDSTLRRVYVRPRVIRT